jgi:hypothetical protein
VQDPDAEAGILYTDEDKYAVDKCQAICPDCVTPDGFSQKFKVDYIDEFACQMAECHRCDQCDNNFAVMTLPGTLEDGTNYASREACRAAECTKQLQTCSQCEDPWVTIKTADNLKYKYENRELCIVNECVASPFATTEECTDCYDVTGKWSTATDADTATEYVDANICELKECTVNDFCYPCYGENGAGTTLWSVLSYASYDQCAAAECFYAHKCDVCQEGGRWENIVDRSTGEPYATEEQCVKDHCATADFPCDACFDRTIWERDTYETQLECAAFDTTCSTFVIGDSSGCATCVKEDWIVGDTTYGSRKECIVGECVSDSTICGSNAFASILDPKTLNDFATEEDCQIAYLSNVNTCGASCDADYATEIDSRTGVEYTSADACKVDQCRNPTCAMCEKNFVDAFRTTYVSSNECRAFECHTCGACAEEYNNWEYFPETFYLNQAECEAVECEVCSKCTTNFRNGFLLEYNSIAECQTAHCPVQESCNDCYTSWDTAFRTKYQSIDHCVADVCNHCGECEANWESTDYFTPVANNQSDCQAQFCHKCSVCHSDNWADQFLPDGSRTYLTARECKAYECFVETAETCQSLDNFGGGEDFDGTPWKRIGLLALTNFERGMYTSAASCEVIEKEGCKACGQWMSYFEDIYFSQAHCEEELCHRCSECADNFDLNFVHKYANPTECQASECSDKTCTACDTHTEVAPVMNPTKGRFFPHYVSVTVNSNSFNIALQKRETTFFESKEECSAELCYDPKCKDCLNGGWETAFKVKYADEATCKAQPFCHNLAKCFDEYDTEIYFEENYASVAACIENEVDVKINGDRDVGPLLVCSECQDSWDKMISSDDLPFSNVEACITDYCYASNVALQVCASCTSDYSTDFFQIYDDALECYEKEPMCHICENCDADYDDVTEFAFWEQVGSTLGPIARFSNRYQCEMQECESCAACQFYKNIGPSGFGAGYTPIFASYEECKLAYCYKSILTKSILFTHSYPYDSPLRMKELNRYHCNAGFRSMFPVSQVSALKCQRTYFENTCVSCEDTWELRDF